MKAQENRPVFPSFIFCFILLLCAKCILASVLNSRWCEFHETKIISRNNDQNNEHDFNGKGPVFDSIKDCFFFQMGNIILKQNCRAIICLLICCRLSCHIVECFFLWRAFFVNVAFSVWFTPRI